MVVVKIGKMLVVKIGSESFAKTMEGQEKKHGSFQSVDNGQRPWKLAAHMRMLKEMKRAGPDERKALEQQAAQ